jgi:hypothetical protein
MFRSTRRPFASVPQGCSERLGCLHSLKMDREPPVPTAPSRCETPDEGTDAIATSVDTPKRSGNEKAAAETSRASHDDADGRAPPVAESATAGYESPNAPPAPLGVEYEFEGVPVIRSTTAIPDWARCDICDCGAEAGDLFRPCNCGNGTRYFHRTCFRTWRQGWINPRNYFCCPDCMTAYRIERVKSSSIASESRERIVSHFRMRMAMFYGGMFLILFALIGGVAGIAYGADNSEKNVPVGVKYMMTSVVNGLPPTNATSIWREQFKQPNVPVWPYYTLLGTFVAALMILVGFAIIGCSFDENERKRRSCSDQCGCGGRKRKDEEEQRVRGGHGGGGGSTTRGGDVYVSYWGCYNCYTPCDVCYCPCDQCCDRCCGNGSSGGCGGGGCGGGNCGGGDCKGGGEALIIIVLIVIVVVLLSAVIVIILYTIKKWTLFHDRMTDMIQNQASELESETIVLGVDETLRPLDAV